MEQSGSKRSLSRAMPSNKSHTSSINIKLMQEEPNRHNRTIFRERGEQPQNLQMQGFSKKYSVKLQSNEKENHSRRRETPLKYEGTLRPFQETNRYLETDRLKDPNTHQRSLSKNNHLKLKTDYDHKLRTDYDNNPRNYPDPRNHPDPKLKPDYADPREATSASAGGKVRVGVAELKALMAEIGKQQREVESLNREMQFIRKAVGRQSGNSVLAALR